MFKVIDSGKALDHYHAKAREICATIHPYMDLTRAFFAGVPDTNWNGPDDDEDEKFVPTSINVRIYVLMFPSLRIQPQWSALPHNASNVMLYEIIMKIYHPHI